MTTQNTLIDLSDNTHNKSRRICYTDQQADVSDIPVDAQFNIESSSDRERFCVADIDYSMRVKQYHFTIDNIDNTKLVDGVSTLTAEINKNGTVTTSEFTFVAASPASDEILIGVDAGATETNIQAKLDALADIVAAIDTGKVDVTANYLLTITTNQTDALTIVNLTDNLSDSTTETYPAVGIQLCFRNGNHGVFTEETPIVITPGIKSIKFDTKGRSFAIKLVGFNNAVIDWLDCEVGGWKTLGR